MTENQQNQLLASWLEQSQDNVGHSSSEPAAQHPITTLCGAQTAMQNGRGPRQNGVRPRRLCPKCSKAARHRAHGSEGTWTSAPGTGGDEAVGEKHLSGEVATREQGQNQTADAARQPKGVHVYKYMVWITRVEQRTLLFEQAPTRTPPSQAQRLPKRESATDRSPVPEKPSLPSCSYVCLIPILLCLQRTYHGHTCFSSCSWPCGDRGRTRVCLESNVLLSDPLRAKPPLHSKAP